MADGWNTALYSFLPQVPEILVFYQDSLCICSLYGLKKHPQHSIVTFNSCIWGKLVSF